MPVIDQNKFYKIMDELFVCCDEHQFRYACKKCDEYMGCQFCSFNPDEPCECEEE
jgi:hypothetical protein